jgi:hydrogenase maturation protein HypF
VWGGEVLIATLAGFERFAHLKYVAMPGSETAVRQPWRMAFAHLYAAIGERAFDRELLARLKLSESDARLLARMIERGVNSPLTSSCGRMFDGAAALILGRDRADYEAQAAIELEGVAGTDWEDSESGYEVSFEGEAPLVLNPSCLWDELLGDLRRGVAQKTISIRFHLGMANAYVRAAIAARAQTGIRNVCLSGGVFHNRLLTRIVRQQLHEAGMEVHLPVQISPGDGGLSYGQVVVAAALISSGTAS